MSDSDEELLPSIANTFNYGNTTVQTFRQNVNRTCQPDLNYRNNMSNSIYNMHPNMRSNFSDYSFNPRSIYNRREVSPMSMRSVPDFDHNMQHSYYRSGMRSLKSNASVRSMDTTASISAADIAQAFKLANFNKYDVRVIKDAFNKYMKSRHRERIEKRRNLRLFLKRSRRRSGEDSGDHGSDTSSSSDDWRSTKSTRSAIPREHILRHVTKANRSEIMKFKNTMRESDMYKDCTENLKQSAFENIVVGNNNKKGPMLEIQGTTQKERFTKGFLLPSQKFNKGIGNTENSQTLPKICQEQRSRSHNSDDENPRNKSISDSENEEIFSRDITREANVSNCLLEKNSLLENESLSGNKRNNDFNFKKPTLPFRKQIKLQNSVIPNKLIISSQKIINRPLASKNVESQVELLQKPAGKQYISKISESNKNVLSNNVANHTKELKSASDSDSDKEEIFGNVTIKENSVQNSILTKQKRALTAQDGISPNSKRSKITPSTSKKLTKPQDKKNVIGKGEILLAKSSQQLNGNVEPNKLNNKSKDLPPLEESVDKSKTTSRSETLSNNDVSMRPSFIKRKLFTQNLDVIDNRSTSSDNLQSPITKNYNFREKNKVRKLASQSCLSRDVLVEDNVLDLIHKIVPPEQINLTNASARQKRQSNPESEDKWDVTSVISMCNNNDISDTYTDEEIFGTNQKSNVINNQVEKANKKVDKKAVVDPQCKVVLEKMQPVKVDKAKNKTVLAIPQSKFTNQISVASCIRSFWDTDYESDDEKIRSLTKNMCVKPNEVKKDDGTISKVKDPVPTTKTVKNNLISTVAKESCQIINAKPTNNCQITKQVNDKLIMKNAKLDKKQALADKAKKKSQNKGNKEQRSKQSQEIGNDISQNISNLSDDLGVITRRRRANKENNISHSNVCERSILTRSQTFKTKDIVNESQLVACEQSLAQGGSRVNNRSLTRSQSSAHRTNMNDSQSSTERSILTRSQSLNGKNLLNISNECILSHCQRLQNNKQTTQPLLKATSTRTGMKTIKSSCTKTQVLKKSPVIRSKTKTICAR